MHGHWFCLIDGVSGVTGVFYIWNEVMCEEEFFFIEEAFY
jgi:hypothetical protein